MNKSCIPLLIVLMFSVVPACHTARTTEGNQQASKQVEAETSPRTTKIQEKPMKDTLRARPVQPLQALPPVVIYKTRGDYYHQVPIGLSADKTRVVSFPAISDLKANGEWALPTPLADGFWLDNRGVDANSAFLDFTYDAYSALSETPKGETLMQYVMDNDPFTEMYVCRCQKDTSQLNMMIRRADFSRCTKVK